MKEKVVAALLMLMPTAVFADAMATAITVFDANTFKAITATHTIGQVADGVLFAKSVFHGYFGAHGKDDVVADFTWDRKPYRLIIGRREAKMIYTVLLMTANQPAQVVAVGEIQRVPVSKEVKDDPKGDPFVVVVRSGNYLKH